MSILFGAATLHAQSGTVFMGDSITEGWLNFHPEFFDGQARICKGISGQVTAQMLERFQKDVIELKPSYVIILAGTNDIALNQGPYDPYATYGNIIAMVQMAAENGITAILSSVLPAARYPWRPEVTDGPKKISALNERLKAYAADHNLVYVDYFKEMVGDDGKTLIPEFSYDGVHPNLKGYEIMESVYFQAVEPKR